MDLFVPRISFRAVCLLMSVLLVGCGGDDGSSSNLSDPRYTLTVSTNGGTVVSTPSGLDCNSECSASFAAGTSVTLNASVVSIGTVQFSWTGDCAGAGASCTMTMDAAKSVALHIAVVDPVASNGGPQLLFSDLVSGPAIGNSERMPFAA
ncbi:MAG: hypothetical protein HY308_15655 [Gammaproteobacteria bacterium]|nr:hypothetical protein [Gammaproteobacteria bacterium]